MNPPFFGTKVITDIKLDDVYRLIDETRLFAGRWKFTPEAFKEWKRRAKDEKTLEPKIVYGYFVVAELALPDLAKPCLPAGRQALQLQFIPLQLVTVGDKVAKKCAELFAEHKYTDYFYLQGLAVETTEALAEYSQRKILSELKISKGSRISPGYPKWPRIEDQKELVKLLDAGRIGVTLTETFQLVPECSTSAMIVV